jgi:hypothetical protein
VLPQESPSLPQGSIDDPNEVLRQQIQPQNITNTTTIEISTIEEGGGILNIPSLKENGEATTMRATFWIETVEPEGQVPFVQLQYSQFVMLRFENIDWPHISVATLIRQ